MHILDVMVKPAKRITGYNLGKKVDEKLQYDLYEKIAKEISKVDESWTYEEIYEKITEKGNIRELVPVESRFGSCPDGLYSPISKDIYINSYILENLEKYSTIPGAIIHEFIHKLQNLNLIFQGKEIRGFQEGATEYYTHKAKAESDPYYKNTGYLSRENGKGDVRYNFESSSYEAAMSIMAQLEVVFGKKKMAEFALHGNKEILLEMQEKYGKDFYEKMRKSTNKLVGVEEDLRLLDECQNEILNVCYQNKYREIQTVDDAIGFLKELKELNYVRGHREGDTSFQNFYNEKYAEIMQRFKGQSEELETLGYKEPQFKKLQEWNQIKKDLRRDIMHYSCVGDLSIDLSRFEKMERFALLKDDVLHHVILVDKKPISYITVSENSYKNSAWIREKDGKYMITYGTKGTNAYLDINENGVYIIGEDSKEEMRKIDKEVTKEEIIQFSTEKRKEYEELNPKSLKDRIKEAIKRRKTSRLNSGKNTSRTEEKENFYQKYKVDENDYVPTEQNKEPEENLNTIDQILENEI